MERIGGSGLDGIERREEFFSSRCLKHTERNTGVFLPDVFALLVGEEHVGGETTLGSIGVCKCG